jgi:tetratricopeptide (TPR) repeat protein
LTLDDNTLLEESIQIGPDQPFTREIPVPPGTQPTQLRAALTAADGTLLVDYQPITQAPVEKLPEPVQAPPRPADIDSIEELYLTGLRVEQIHNPRVNPLDYYLEALQRDPGDARCNTMVGINYNRRGMYAEAEEHLRRAVERLTQDYTRARDGEPHFQLGVALLGQHRLQDAYDQFARSAWDQACQAAANYQLAAIACRQQQYTLALDHVRRCLSVNTPDLKAQCLCAAILRKLDRRAEAEPLLAQALLSDPLDFWARHELVLCRTGSDSTAASSEQETLDRLMRDDVQAYLELASDYMSAGLWSEAIEVLQRPIAAQREPCASYPLLHYYLGYAQEQTSGREAAQSSYLRAAQLPLDYCFPFRLESRDVLLAALAVNPRDARAEYYLGNLLFDLQPQVAMEHWENARRLDPALVLAHRNAGWATYRVQNDVDKAISCYEAALASDEIDPRLLLELDLLYEAGNVDPQRRLKALDEHHTVVVQREDSFLREIIVLVLNGNYSQAIEYLENNFFHAQEGRSEIHDVYVDAHLLAGLTLLDEGQPREALEHFRKAAEYPENLSVGRPKNDPRAPEIAYFTGVALEALGEQEPAQESYRKAADQPETSRWPETRYYQGLSLVRLERPDEARQLFQDLIEDGRRQLSRQEGPDFFAKFGQESSQRTRNATAHYRIGLGLSQTGEPAEAAKEFELAAELDQSHPWARYYRDSQRQQVEQETAP